MKLYNNKYDAYYDDVKNVWLEDVCGSKGCEYCSNRPSEPLQAPYQQQLELDFVYNIN